MTDYSNLAPGLGFAASLSDSLVLRGGYGLSYFPGNITSDATMKNAPFISNQQFQNSTSGVPALRLGDGLPTPEPTDHRSPTGNIGAVALDFRSTRVHQFQRDPRAVDRPQRGGHRLCRLARRLRRRPDQPEPASGGRRQHLGPAPVRRATAWGEQHQSLLVGLRVAVRLDAARVPAPPGRRAGFSFNYTLAHNQRTDGAPWDESVIEKFAADHDVRHRVVLSVTYEMPYRGTGAAVGVLRDWQVNGVAYWQSGRPFNVQNASPHTPTPARAATAPIS